MREAPFRFVSHCSFVHFGARSYCGSESVIAMTESRFSMFTGLPHSLQETESLVLGIQFPSEVVNSGARQDVYVTCLNMIAHRILTFLRRTDWLRSLNGMRSYGHLIPRVANEMCRHHPRIPHGARGRG